MRPLPALPALRLRTLASALLLASCGGAPPATADRRPDSAPATDPSPPVPTVEQLVDSSLRALRQGVPPVGHLTGGAGSRDALARRFVAAAARRDTAALRGLLVTRAEFAWLYFPHARLARPPYGVDPGFLWMQVGSNTARDLPKALERLSPGTTLRALTCGDGGLVEGPNRLHEGCLAVVSRGGRRDTLSAFGSILERDGRFKFLSYANRL